jgi:muconolactone D-isomerase
LESDKMEFLTNVTIDVPDGTPDATVEKTKKAEAARAAELAAQGHLLRLWRPPLKPGEWRTMALFRADNDKQLKDIIATLPLHIWMTVEVMPLTAHPSDPATQQASETSTNNATKGSRSGTPRILATTRHPARER